MPTRCVFQIQSSRAQVQRALYSEVREGNVFHLHVNKRAKPNYCTNKYRHGGCIAINDFPSQRWRRWRFFRLSYSADMHVSKKDAGTRYLAPLQIELPLGQLIITAPTAESLPSISP